MKRITLLTTLLLCAFAVNAQTPVKPWRTKKNDKTEVKTDETVKAENDKAETKQTEEKPVEKPAKQKLTANILIGPYLQAVSEDGFTVVWRTDMDAVSWVEVAPNDGTHFFERERPKYYQSVFGKRPIGTLHSVRVDGLKKGTTYRYRIMQQSVLTARDEKRQLFGIASGNNPFRELPYTVTTRDSDADTLKFAIVNDIHANDSIFSKLMTDIPNYAPDFVVLNGDMLSAMDSEQQLFDGYLRSAAKLFAGNIPFYNLRGNHESRGTFSYEYMNYFPSTTGKPYYMVRQGPAALLMLDCGEDKPDSDISYFGLMLSDQYREKEAEWLAEIIESDEFKSAPVKIAVLHIPISKGGWHANIEINRLFLPLLEKAGIDLMLSGHIHRYAFNEAGERGCSFPVLINGAREKHYIQVTKDNIVCQRIDAAGTILKEYSIEKKQH